jgi:hypothetical protein
MAPMARISLELARSEPISGSARNAEGEERQFSGWLELHATIERLRRGADDRERAVTRPGSTRADE